MALRLFSVLLLRSFASGDPASSAPGSSTEEVDIDLLHGIVKGYSQFITFLASPSPTSDKSCSARAVVRIDFTGPFNRARLVLDYDKPRLWTLDVSDSPTGDGYGGDEGKSLDIFSQKMELYIYILVFVIIYI